MIESQAGSTSSPQAGSASSAAAPPIISAWRIRFLAQAQPGQRVIRRFVDPVAAVAVAETIEPNQLAALLAAAGEDEFYVVQVSTIESLAGRSIHQSVMGSDPARSEESSPRATRVETNAGQLFWKPGRMLIESRCQPDEAVLDAVLEFAFVESHLRQVEKELRQFEATAPADARRAYPPNRRERREWPRMMRSAQELSLLRLRAAHMEPAAYLPSRDLPPASRRLISRLIARAAMEDRLEAVSARLEACEDLYEAAVDRIVEQRGQRLEVAIIVILLIETVFIFTELGLALFRGPIH